MVGIALLVASSWVSSTLRYLPFGRRLYAIGSNPDAARTAGLPVQRDVFTAFAICGALSGLAGFMFLVRFGNITVTAAQGLELQVVAAVVVGGVNIFGGSGSMIGALLGVLLIEILQQSLLRWAGVSEFVKDAILGLAHPDRGHRRRHHPGPAAGDVGAGPPPRPGARRRRPSRDGEGAVAWRVSSLRRLRGWEGLLLVVPARGPGLQHHAASRTS